MDDDWTPPTEEEMKLIEARRARSDQISKLMASYMLKGYKMLGINCDTCATILLQDRSDTKHCIACEELDCDTVKDDPALRPLGAPSPSVKAEPKAPAGAQTSTLTASATCSPRISATTPRLAACSPCATNLADTEAAAEYLSMSSIDVHCWPANPTDLAGGSGDPAAHASSKTVQQSAAVAADSRPTTFSSPQLHSSEDISACLQALKRKIVWASQALEQSSNVDSSTSLCKLIKEAAEAIVAVRKASL